MIDDDGRRSYLVKNVLLLWNNNKLTKYMEYINNINLKKKKNRND